MAFSFWPVWNSYVLRPEVRRAELACYTIVGRWLDWLDDPLESLTTPHALALVLSATIVLPFLVLVADYILRVDVGLNQTMRNSGPDLCLLGLGSVGSVFLDPKIAAGFLIPPQLAGAVVIVIIFALRGVCFRLQRLTTTGAAVGTMIVGLAAVCIVGSILVYAYRG